MTDEEFKAFCEAASACLATGWRRAVSFCRDPEDSVEATLRVRVFLRGMTPEQAAAAVREHMKDFVARLEDGQAFEDDPEAFATTLCMKTAGSPPSPLPAPDGSR